MRFIYTSLAVILFQSLQAQPNIDLELVVSGVNAPVAIVNAGDDRLFIVERPGKIRIIDAGGSLKSTPFLDISSFVESGGGEQGLLGLAFHPNYATNGYFFINYIGNGDTSHIARLSVSSSDPDQADPNSLAIILSVYQPYTNHNGGDLHFGPDGYLYAGFGDGGSGGDPGNRAQDKMTMLGKILRIDIDVFPYAIPPDNPFAGTATILDELWAIGLRNPWRFSFDRLTGDMWIADVGQNSWEEINFQPASSPGGENYGWRCYEADTPFNTSGCDPFSSYDAPIHKYPNTGFGGDCSVTGGYRYRGSNFPAMEGYYFFGDYCSSKLWALHESTGNWVSTFHGVFDSNWFSAFGEGNDGELYVAGVKSNKIFHIVDTSGIVGVNEKFSFSGFNLYPNPSGSFLNIELTDTDFSDLTYTIRDIQGSTYLTGTLSKDKEVIDVSSLRAGLYQIQLSGKDINESRRFIRK